MPSNLDLVTRPRTRSQARAESDVARPAADPVPPPVVENPKARARTRSSGANAPRVATPAKPRARTKSSPTVPVALPDDPAPARRVTRSSTAAEKPEGQPPVSVEAKVPTQDQPKKHAGRAAPSKKHDKRQDRLRERATTAAALANGQTPPPRSRTRSMANAAREVRFRTPTPPSDVAQSVPARMPASPALGATDTVGSTGSGRLETSDLGSTPMGHTTGNVALGATQQVMKEALMKEIGNNIEEGDEAYATELYRDLISDAKIEASLQALGYDPNAEYRKGGVGRWTALPTKPTSEAAIQGPITALVTTILAKLAPKDKRNTRRAEDTSATLLQHRDDLKHTTKPDISIVATGPSFELPYAHAAGASTTIGFSNLATAFELKLDKSKGGHKTNIEQQPNRKFVRALMITEHQVRLLHFDRSGVKYSPFINIHRDPFTFVRLILGLSSPKEEVLGLDTNVQWKIERGRKVSGTIKMVDSNQESVTFDLIDVHPVFHRAALRGRGTTCWHARDRDGNPLDAVLIKDAWRGEDRVSEHAMLEKVKGVNGVAQMLHYCDNLAQTKDFRGRQVPEQPNFFNRVWLRVVLKQYGRSLKHFTSQRQAIGALRDTLAAHSRLLEHKSVLHRDISMQNLLLGLPDALPGLRGILVDFDMAVQAEGRDVSDISVDCRTGTRMYQSMSVLWSYEPESNATAHDYLDDIESFFLVLAHLMFGWSGIEQEIKPKPVSLLDWDNDVPRIARVAKELFLLKDLDMTAIASFWSDPCRDLLESFHAFLKGISAAKEKMRKASNPDSRLKRLQKLHAKRQAHYDTIKAMFDKALDEIERYGEKPSTRGSGDSDSEDDLSSPTPPARISKRGSDDVEETPSKRNRTSEYNGTRLSQAVDEDNETLDD